MLPWYLLIRDLSEQSKAAQMKSACLTSSKSFPDYPTWRDHVCRQDPVYCKDVPSSHLEALHHREVRSAHDVHNEGFNSFDHDPWLLPQELTALPGLPPGYCYWIGADCGSCLLLMVPPCRLRHTCVHLGCSLSLGIALAPVGVLAKNCPVT